MQKGLEARQSKLCQRSLEEKNRNPKGGKSGIFSYSEVSLNPNHAASKLDLF